MTLNSVRNIILNLLIFLDKDGTIISSIDEFNQLDRFDARKKILQLLEKNSLLINTKKYITKLPYSFVQIPLLNQY